MATEHGDGDDYEYDGGVDACTDDGNANGDKEAKEDTTDEYDGDNETDSQECDGDVNER